MPKVVINQFNGGLDEDVRSHNTTTFKDVAGFDTLTYKHRLTPLGESESEALSSGTITDKQITDINRDSSGYLTFFGRYDGSSPTVTTLYVKDSGTNIASTMSQSWGDSAGALFLQNTSAFYNGYYYYNLANAAGTVRKMASGTGISSTAGTFPVSAYWTGEIGVKPLLHTGDNKLYIARQQYIAQIGTTMTNASLTIASNQTITSLSQYGNDIAIAVAPFYEGGGPSQVLIWGRSMVSTNLRSVIDWGNDSLLILENLGGTLVGVSISNSNYSSSSSYTTSKVKKISVRAYIGSQVVTIKEIVVPASFELRNFKAKTENKLYFGGDNGDALYVVKLNDKSTRIDSLFTVSKSFYVNNGSAYTTLKGIGIYGDYLWTMFDTAGQTGNVYRTKVTSSYTNTSFYESNINPSMPLDDRIKLKSLKKVVVSTAPLPANGSITLKYSVDGGAYETLFTETTDNRITTFTDSDSTGAPLKDGYEYQFKIESTGGAEVTELRYEYDVTDLNV